MHVFIFEACLDYLSKSIWYFIFGKNFTVDRHNDVGKAKHIIESMQPVHQSVQEHLEEIKRKYKKRHVKHLFDHDFQVEDQVGFQQENTSR